MTRTLATGRLPASAKAVYDGTDVDVETAFDPLLPSGAAQWSGVGA
ncbi:hypothetical protein ACLVWQ_11220 [Streptomyces sp. CWNU-52B]